METGNDIVLVALLSTVRHECDDFCFCGEETVIPKKQTKIILHST